MEDKRGKIDVDRMGADGLYVRVAGKKKLNKKGGLVGCFRREWLEKRIF